MKLYVFLITFSRRYLHGFFWHALLPGVFLFVLLPLSFPLLYYIEKQINVRAEEQAYVYEQYEFGNVSVASQQAPGVLGITAGGGAVSDTDYRAIVLDEFFRRNDSPLYGYGKVFVEKCDYYGAPYDCTTLPAIAWVETRLCGYSFSHDQRNCWGFGGSGPNRIWFENYEAAIDLITDRLVNAYGPRYMVDPEAMQHTYCGPHCNSWGPGVQQMRYHISALAIEMGYPPLITNDEAYK